MVTFNNRLNSISNSLRMKVRILRIITKLFIKSKNQGYFQIYKKLKLKVRKLICFEANQGGDSPIQPPEIPKPQHEINTL